MGPHRWRAVSHGSTPNGAIQRLATEEAARAERDPNYRWLVQDIAAADELRKLTSVSLNLETRKAERERLDAERLARENQRRSALGQPAIKSFDEVDASQAPDVVLDQASEVMADMVLGLRPDPSRPAPRTIRARNEPAAPPSPK
ncbi:MAG: carboxy terminal-processing peptidase [Steroidobacteraceae bacterium]